MKLNKTILLITFITCVSLLNPAISGTGAPLDYTTIGISMGQRYSWTLSDVNDSLVEDTFGGPQVFIRNGKEITVSIERIVDNTQGYEADNWSIEYEILRITQEIDDDGTEEQSYIHKNPATTVGYFGSLFGMSGHPWYVPFKVLFVPKNTEAFLNETASLFPQITSDVLVLNATSGSNYIVYTYDVNGILQSLSYYKSNMLMYTFSGGIAAGISAGLIFIPIAGICVIGIIYIMMKNKRIKIKNY